MTVHQYCRPSFIVTFLVFMISGAVTVAQDPTHAIVTSNLIEQQRITLTLAGAEHLVTAAKVKARDLGTNVNIAVVDDGGHLLAFIRMDKVRPASVSTAMTKAVAAATSRQATGPLRKGDTEPDLLLNLSLQNAAAANGGKMTALLGGIPIAVDGQVIGAIGIGGSTGEQDAEIAKAAVESFLKSINSARSK